MEISVLVSDDDRLVEIKVPIEKVKSEIEGFLRQLEPLITPTDQEQAIQIEELEFQVAITNEGKLALISTYVTDADVRYTIKVLAKRISQKDNLLVQQAAKQQSNINQLWKANISKQFNTGQGRYQILASSKTPGLIIFLVDASPSMNKGFQGETRIDKTNQLLFNLAVKLVQLSTKGTTVIPRYRIAMFAYSSKAIDLLVGIKDIEQVAQLGIPQLTTLDMSDENNAFGEVENLILSEIPNLQDCPAPLVYHITDGDSNRADLILMLQRIMQLITPDGNLIVVNVLVNDSLQAKMSNEQSWKGFQSAEEIDLPYGRLLFEVSSAVPETYRTVMEEYGFAISANSRLLFPAHYTELCKLAFPRPAATPTTRPSK